MQINGAGNAGDRAGTNATAAATTSPATVPVEKEIKWANGTAVQGNNAQRSYSLATSQKYTIDPTLGGHDWKGHNVYLWVIWAKVTIDDTGTDPANAPPLTKAKNDFGGNNLGLFYFANKNAVDFQNCQIAQVTPAGVHNVVSGGFVMKQDAWVHGFKNVTVQDAPNYWDTQWEPDNPGTFAYSSDPDSNDKVYAIDNPNVALFGNSEYDQYANFRDYLQWDGTTCSGYGTWYFEAGAKQGDNPVIYFAQGGTGQINLPNADPQKAENPN